MRHAGGAYIGKQCTCICRFLQKKGMGIYQRSKAIGGTCESTVPHVAYPACF